MSYVPLSSHKRFLLGTLSVVLALVVFFVQVNTPGFETSPIARQAAHATQKAYAEILKWRLEKGIPIDSSLDPNGTGLIGCEYSDITSTVGDLKAKQLSVNPAFSALITTWLYEAGVRQGDSVAVSFSGSFPALNIATLCALDALGANGVVFSSVGASVYGANIPGFSWLDMEKHLKDKGLITNHTRFASLGGIADTEGGIDGTGITIAEKSISENGARYIREGTPKSVVRDTKRRMQLYFSEGMPKAFVNVGGNITSLGWIPEAALLANGPLNLDRIPSVTSSARGTIFRMAEKGIPVIHILNIKRLSNRYHVATYIGQDNLDLAFSNARKSHLITTALVLLVWGGLCLVTLIPRAHLPFSRR